LSCGGASGGAALLLASFGAGGCWLIGIDTGTLKPRLDPTEFAMVHSNYRQGPLHDHAIKKVTDLLKSWLVSEQKSAPEGGEEAKLLYSPRQTLADIEPGSKNEVCFLHLSEMC
jgi:hypothetical protein